LATKFEQEIDAACAAEPFVPFYLVLSGGIRYEVLGPDEVVSADTVIYHYPPKTDRKNILRTNQLAAIEFEDLSKKIPR
jgi:hypothetical protein